MKIQTTRTAYNKRLESAIGKFERDTALKPTVKKLRSIISNSQKSKSSVSTLTSDNSFHRNVLLTSLLASQIVPVDSLSRPSADNSTSPFFPPNHLKFSPLNTTAKGALYQLSNLTIHIKNYNL